MKKQAVWITETAAMLALLIGLQWAGSLIPEQTVKQLITGSCVNAVLAVTALLIGKSSGITVALISPVCAFFFGIAPNFITVVPIMAGNAVFVLLLKTLYGKSLWRQITAVIVAALAKFLLLYLLVVVVICDLAAGALLGKKIGQTVVLAPPMLNLLPAMFTWPQLITALAGGSISLTVVPTLRRALKR